MPDSTPPEATPIAAKKAKLPKATVGDIIISVVLPFCGVIIGVIALIKGEGRRAGTMIAIGGVIVAVCVWLWWSDTH